MKLSTFDALKRIQSKNAVQYVCMEGEILKKYHQILLEIASDIISVCEKEKIVYQLSGGTALGAVRHKGFIPWDDDLDINILGSQCDEFIEKFEKAAEKLKLSYAHGKVHYDLDEKLSDIEYYDLAMKDGFESVFHKVKEGYEIQNEVRFAVINPDKPEHMELMLEKDLKLKFTLIPLRYGKDILIELSNLEFDDKLNLPIRFSSEIKYYESER